MRIALNAEQIAVWKFIARITFRFVGSFFVKSDRLLARSSPACGLTACSCSYGRVFDTPFLKLGLTASTLGFSTVGVTPSGHLLSDD